MTNPSKAQRIAEAKVLCRLFHFNTKWYLHMYADWHFEKFGKYLLKICPECLAKIKVIEGMYE